MIVWNEPTLKKATTEHETHRERNVLDDFFGKSRGRRNSENIGDRATHKLEDNPMIMSLIPLKHREQYISNLSDKSMESNDELTEVRLRCLATEKMLYFLIFRIMSKDLESAENFKETLTATGLLEDLWMAFQTSPKFPRPINFRHSRSSDGSRQSYV